MNFEVERLYRDSETLSDIREMVDDNFLEDLIYEIETRDRYNNDELLERALGYLEVLLNIKNIIKEN